MPAIVTAREGAERGIIDVMTPGAERRDAAFHRCRSLTGRWRGRGERCFRRGRAVVQNVSIGVVERDRPLENPSNCSGDHRVV